MNTIFQKDAALIPPSSNPPLATVVSCWNLAMSGITRPPYNGDCRNLVMAIDFGTTYSGASYAFLDPGQPPTIRSVTGFRGQEDQNSSTKVPTVVYYDSGGKVCAVGGDTNPGELMDEADIEGWIKVEWFKLLLRPRELDREMRNAPIPQLPPGKTVEMVLGDFLEYMKGCAKDFIIRTHANGDKMWNDVAERITYVLSHPNGWHGFQQTKLREAAILGKLIPNTDDGKARITFVSEGEASFHWCVDSGLARESLGLGCNIVVVDAGGGTIDVSAFKVVTSAPLELEETKASLCRLTGSIFVTQAFENYVRVHLRGTHYTSDGITLDRLKADFDQKTKRLFRDDTRIASVTFGGPRDNHAAFNIKAGKLFLKRDLVTPFFEASCAAAVSAIRSQIAGNRHTTVFLVGGFAASTYLFTQIQSRLKGHPVDIKRAESHHAKAVAEGAIGFYLDRYITARVAKCTYGVQGSPRFLNSDPAHRKRMDQLYSNPVSGISFVKGKFFPHITKGTAVKETCLTRVPFTKALDSNTVPAYHTFNLYAYTGNVKDITWCDEDPDEFRRICTFSATIPGDCLIPETGGIGRTKYWYASYDAVVTFGMTEFKCYIEWKDKQGTIKRGPMAGVWDEG